MRMVKIFKVKPEHIKLLKQMYVSWNNCEYGAPTVDPKRPYGNSSVTQDIHKILTDSEGEPTEKQENKYNSLHQEMEVVLQILLCNLRIKPGTYEAEEYSREWKRKS